MRVGRCARVVRTGEKRGRDRGAKKDKGRRIKDEKTKCVIVIRDRAPRSISRIIGSIEVV